jgi:hypothetical protein
VLRWPSISSMAARTTGSAECSSPSPIQQGKLIAQAPEHHEGDDVTGVLRPVQRASTPLVELLAAGATTEPVVTLSGALAPFRNGC